MNELKLGVLLPTREIVMAGHNDPEPLLKLAARAEEAGFDSVWVGDSLFKSARFEPLMLLSAIAARTERVSIGTAILISGLRHPLLLAHAAATLDQISSGRLILGLGAGWLKEEFDAVGVPYKERVGRLAEAIRCCRTLWSGEPTTFSGRYFEFQDVELRPVPKQSGGPPIWVGGMGPGALRIAGRVGDGWFPTSPDSETFRNGWTEVQAAAKEARRGEADLTPAAYVTVNLDAKKGPDEIRNYAQNYYGIPFEVMQQIQGYFAGEPEPCTEWLKSFVDAGVRHLVLRFGTTDPEPHLERLASKVLPELRGLSLAR